MPAGYPMAGTTTAKTLLDCSQILVLARAAWSADVLMSRGHVVFRLWGGGRPLKHIYIYLVCPPGWFYFQITIVSDI